MYYIILSVLSFFTSTVSLPSPPFGTTAGAYDTLSRTLQLDARTKFTIILDPLSAPCSTIDSTLRVVAPNAVDAVYIVAQYIRETFNASFSWAHTGGITLGSLPSAVATGSPLPPPAGGFLSLCRAVNYTYYQNVVQSSYSNVWWTASRWRDEVDWMALHGINAALAYGGQEALFRDIYLQLGLTADDIGLFFNGPAFLSWSRGQGQAGVGGPLPLWWYQEQLTLNQALVGFMQTIGIQPILPIFQGNVPLTLTKLFPKSNISSGGWLDVFDPLFTRIQDSYMTSLFTYYPKTALHWYEGDGLFMAGSPPWVAFEEGGTGSIGGTSYGEGGALPPDPDALARSKAAYSSFSKHDVDAVWVYQSWIWRGFSSQKDLAYATGWLSGVPLGNFFILDQTAERIPIWQKFDNFSFNGQPFAWLSMNNMGGNVGLVGALEWVAQGVAGALENSRGALAGIGMDPEGINSMPSYWEYVLSTAWKGALNTSSNNLLADWGVRRCGREIAGVRTAYALLAETVFNVNQSNDEHHLIYCGTAMPLKGAGNGWDRESAMIRANYPASLLAQSWSLLLTAAPLCDSPLTYDLVDIAREYISLFPCVKAHDALNAAMTMPTLVTANSSMVSILTDLDTLLSSMDGFLTGSWIADARSLSTAAGGSASETDLLEWNARSQISTWFPSPPTPDNHLYDYANKQWGGITKDYYLQRYILLASRIQEAIHNGSGGGKIAVNVTGYLLDLGLLGKNWTTTTVANVTYPDLPFGDAINISKLLFQRYATN